MNKLSEMHGFFTRGEDGGGGRERMVAVGGEDGGGGRRAAQKEGAYNLARKRKTKTFLFQ